MRSRKKGEHRTPGTLRDLLKSYESSLGEEYPISNKEFPMSKFRAPHNLMAAAFLCFLSLA
jgi:hypothetical protein